jgi:hypothetical protein
MCEFDSQQPLFDTLVVILLSNGETRKGAYLRGHDAACINGLGLFMYLSKFAIHR